MSFRRKKFRGFRIRDTAVIALDEFGMQSFVCEIKAERFRSLLRDKLNRFRIQDIGGVPGVFGVRSVS